VRALAVVVAVATLGDAPRAQAPPLEEVLERMGAYLLEYEAQLSSIVADEVFEQKIFYRRTTSTRRLESEVAFMRLPGGAGWLGFRDVRKVDYQPIKKTSQASLVELLSSSAGDTAKATAMAQASAAHNLGLPRTINVPTATLEIVHPRHWESFEHRLQGRESVRGAATVIVAFQEQRRPIVVREPGGKNLVSSGRIWVEPKTGAVWRVEWFYRPEADDLPDNIVPRLRVEYAPNKALGFLVPVEMIEGFSAAPFRGEGKASYKNFRRFGTSARIVPQP
jgi:hypothetical protein